MIEKYFSRKWLWPIFKKCTLTGVVGPLTIAGYRTQYSTYDITDTKVERCLFSAKYELLVIYQSPRRYPYFDVVVGLVWSHDPKSYAGGSLCYW
jgi:hypothetical protein